MANKRKLTVDKTFLSLDMAEERGFIHRDYIAHCLRWTHFCKLIAHAQAYKTARILDVGCGRELPLARTLYSSRLIPVEYVGVDAGPVNDDALSIVTNTGTFPATVYEHTDICEDGFLDDMRDAFDFITCFEVLEHVEPDHMLRMLRRFHALMKTDGTVLISTPNFNGTDCAANHVDEIRYDVLGSCLELCGFTIKDVYGTFASQRDYVPKLTGQELVLFNNLSDYYDSNFLSCVFAPLYPRESRNALWVLTAADKAYSQRDDLRFPPLQDLHPENGGSSCRWGTLVREGWLAKFISDLQ